MAKDDLVYVIPAGQYGKEGVLALLEQHPEIKFVSLVGIDLAGNDTDEKIPISVFFDEAAVAGITGISDDNTIERSLLGAHSAQTNFNHGYYLQK